MNLFSLSIYAGSLKTNVTMHAGSPGTIAKIKSAELVVTHDDSKAVLIKTFNPKIFCVVPVVKLKNLGIDPFGLAVAATSKQLSYYVNLYCDDSETGKGFRFKLRKR